MQDYNKPCPGHVMKEGRHRGEERWTGSSLRRFVRCSASISSRCSSSSVPFEFAITARVGEGGVLREYRLLWIDVRRAVRKEAVL